MKEITQTMSSLELVKLINTIRKEENNTIKVEHYTFMEKIKKVLGKDHQNFLGIYLDSINREKPCYYLPKRESNLMVMSESYKVRAAVYDKMVELEQENTKLLKQQVELLKLQASIAKYKTTIEKATTDVIKHQTARKVLEAKTTKLLAQGAKVKGDMSTSKLSMPVDNITNLLSQHGSTLTPAEANNTLVRLGFLSPDKTEVTALGSYYGRTIKPSPKAKTSVARWFTSEFSELLPLLVANK